MERVLLDTNIIIHRERDRVIRTDIGNLFNKLDSGEYKKCIHPLTVEEIQKHKDSKLVTTMSIKMEGYHQLKTIAPLHTKVEALSSEMDKSGNDRVDSHLLNELLLGRVDYLITEDKKIHAKAAKLGISSKVFRIATFISKAVLDEIDLVDYKVLSIKQKYFGEVNLDDPFFETFKEAYLGFDRWFQRKCDEICYVSTIDNAIAAFLFIKIEDGTENYQDIAPSFVPKRRLKIGTFKVINNGIRLGERFLKVIFDNARSNRVEEIYVTIFDNRPELLQLISFLGEWGFVHHGTKNSAAGVEQVYVRDFKPNFIPSNVKLTYPFIGSWLEDKLNRVFIVPIKPEYHTKLFPDSVLNTEKGKEFDDSQPYRNSICKSYVSRSMERNLQAGDIIVFYRTGDEGTQKWYTSTITTIGIVESIHNDLETFEELERLCKKRTVLSSEELLESWNRHPKIKPFVVNFLFAYSLKKRPNMKTLSEELGILSGPNDAPRGFRRIDWDKLQALIKFGL